MSPWSRIANARWAIPSLLPNVTIASESKSKSILYFDLYLLQIAFLSRGMPFDEEYPWVSHLEDTSFNLSTICFGVGPSGFPIERSIMSWPALLNSIFNSEVTLKTYCGSLEILLKLCIKKGFLKNWIKIYFHLILKTL